MIQRYQQDHEDNMSITSACEYVGRSPSGYHKHQNRKDQPPKKKGRPATDEVDEEMTEVISWIRRCWAPIQLGYRRITAILNHHLSITANKKKVQRIMQIKGWQAKQYTRPTRPSPDPEDPNRQVTDPKDPVQVQKPDTCWSTDLTKIYVEEVGWANLIPVLDNCTRECVGWVFSHRGRAIEAKDAIREAVINQFGHLSEVPDGLQLLTDNGSIFLAHDFVNEMNNLGIDQKYTPFRCPTANGIAERFMRTIKEEKVWHHRFETMEEAEKVIANWIERYNQQRLHSSLDDRSPVSFRAFLREKVA